MKKIAQLILKFLARAVIKKYQPEVIAITGSVGKSSTKEAIALVLRKNNLSPRVSLKNYNNEIGLPLTILGGEAPGKSLGNWLKLIAKGLKLIFKNDLNYPPILILEYGVDRPGDMNYLLSIAKPQVSVITYVGESHLEFFGKVENIKKEKQILVENTAKDGLVVLNYDNQLVREMREASRARITTFGLETGADIIAQEINFNYEAGAGVNTNFKVNSGGSLVPINFSALGAPALYAALAATAVGLYYQINLVNIASALADFKQPAGRLRIMPGKNNSILIDDAYNSAPTSVLAALDILANFKTTGRRIAILGSMLELGDLSSKGHRAVGERVAELNLDQLITVGELADEIATAAEESGLAKSKILSFKDSTSASAVLGDFPEAGDVILIKASRGVALDRVVEVLGA